MKQISPLLPVCLLLLSLNACMSTEDRLAKLEKTILKVLPRPEYFVVKGDKDTLQLLLPAPGAGRLAAEYCTVKETVAQMDTAGLTEREKLAVKHYYNLLDSACANPLFFNNPAQYSVAYALKNATKQPTLDLYLALLEKIPDYYAQVQQNWHTPEPTRIKTAVNQCVGVLDELNQAEQEAERWAPEQRNRLYAAIPAARAAVKDFIGLCESGKLQ